MNKSGIIDLSYIVEELRLEMDSRGLFVGQTTGWLGIAEEIPVNYLLLDGDTYQRSDYPQLYDIFAKRTDFVGDATTFTLPLVADTIIRAK